MRGDSEGDAEQDELDDELHRALAPLGRMPPAPTWLTTKLTAEFRRRRGQLGPQRRIVLEVVSDSRTTGLVGVRAAAPGDAGDYTIHLRSELDGAPEVVLDVRADAEVLALDGLVFGGAGVAYHVRATTPGTVEDAQDTSADGRFSFRGLAAGRYEFVLDDGHDMMTALVDLSTGGTPHDH